MTDRRTKPILITGGCGFIGCNLADRLAERGDRVLLLDNLARAGVRENAQWLKSRHPDRIDIVVADVRDPISVIDAVRDAGAVLHLAAQVAVTSSLDKPLDDFEINARGTLNVLEAVRLHAPEAPVIFASTNKVYGRLVEDSEIARTGLRYAPLDPALANGVSEAAPLDFYSPYGCSKGTADQYVRDYARIYGLRSVVFRQSCIYGPRQFGIEDQGWVAWFTIAAVLGRPITIFGDGRQVRDVLYADDLAECYLRAVEHIDHTQGQIYNVGGGPDNQLSLLELLELLGARAGRKITTAFADWRPGDQKVFVSDIGKAKRDFGWFPKVSATSGVDRLADWVLQEKALLASVLG